jgi:acyl-CoA thioesterase
VAHRFDEDTALVPAGPGVYAGRIAPTWSVGRGANGGYLAAIVVRALGRAVGDAARRTRSLTVQYLAAAEDGPFTIATSIERAGGSLTMVSARLMQGGRPIALALATCAAPRPGPALADVAMPAVEPPEVLATFHPAAAPLHFTAHYEYRWAIGDPPFSGSSHARVGGWLRLAERRVADAPLVAAFTDAWMPSILARLRGPAAVPTVDLTIHFRAELPLPGAAPDDFYLVTFHSALAVDGCFVEDGEIWARDGTLLAQSRQLALLRPLDATVG